jgi:hypothetical protein
MSTPDQSGRRREVDTSAIAHVVARACRRIRAQRALEGAATATVLAAATALVAIFAMRVELVSPATGLGLLVGAGVLIVAGAVISATRKLDDEVVARRVDRASNLADRLSTAIAFVRELHSPGSGAPSASSEEDERRELMTAAIRDGARSAARANVRAATPFAIPRDARAALGFLAISALAAGLSVPHASDEPRVFRATPDHAAAGSEVAVDGEHLAHALDAVYLGTLEQSRPVAIIEVTDTHVVIQVPDNAPIGDSKLIAFAHGRNVGQVDFSVVDKKDVRFHKENTVALEPDEKAYVEAILAELRQVAQRDQVPELDDFAKKIEALLAQAENGEISKEQLLDALSKAEDALNKQNEPDPQEVDKQLADMGKQLAQDPLTKPLGDALEKHDLEKAQQALEKLADKLDKKELSDQQQQDLAKKLDQVSKQMQKQDDQKDKQQSAQQQKLEDQIRRLQQQKDQAKNDEQRQDLERRLEDKKRELQKLQKEDEQRKESDQRRAVKRLEKDMEKAAENLEKPQKQSGDKQDQEQGEQQASQKLRDAARETGRVDKDQRKQASQKRMASQMDDLREALRRAKQKGSKGPQDPFNRQGKNQDFISRARGQQGQQGAWKPGQTGQGQGQQGSGQQGSGAQQGGKEWGVGHDPNLTGDPTQISGNDKDQQLQGKQGNQGESTRETILSSAQKGFASVGYAKVYADYQRIVEEVMRTEKLPSSYKYYVKRYFAKIHPSMAPASLPERGNGAAPAAEGTP